MKKPARAVCARKVQRLCQKTRLRRFYGECCSRFWILEKTPLSPPHHIALHIAGPPHFSRQGDAHLDVGVLVKTKGMPVLGVSAAD